MLDKLAPLLVLGLAGTGCYFESDGGYAPTGTLVVDWTVEGSKRASACYRNAADALDVAIYDEHDHLVDGFQEACEAFETSIELYPGTYYVDTTLVDFDGLAVTTTASELLHIDDRRVTVSAVDFPFDSFL